MTPKSLSSLKRTATATVAKYTAGNLHYAFKTYDRAGELDAPLTASDVLSANLLSLKLGWREVIPLFADGDGPEQELRRALDNALEGLRNAKPFETYDSLEALEAAVASLAAANAATENVRNWTPVTVSKVLHRRRPQIVPINDSRVRKFYGVKTTESEKLRAALWNDIRENVVWMKPLAASTPTPGGQSLSLLRLADILIWTP